MLLGKEQRRRYFVDPQVQGALLRQALYYWLWTSGMFALIVFTFRVFPAWLSGTGQEPGRIWYHMAPYVVASALLLPVVIFSAIRFSHRFSGPMVRIRKNLKQLAQGDTRVDVTLRRNDFWSDIADDINQIAARLHRELPSKSAAPSAEENDFGDAVNENASYDPDCNSQELAHSAGADAAKWSSRQC